MKSAIKAGVWHGRITRVDSADAPVPKLSAWHLEAEIGAPQVIPSREGSGLWDVFLPIPAEILADGVQTVLICEEPGREVLQSFTLVTGEPLERDIRAEMDLLRAELDMLKRAFRRHCVETL
ncbi:MAG: hypothetical protein AAGB18_03090 [Pseudomonadota bacterium]